MRRSILAMAMALVLATYMTLNPQSFADDSKSGSNEQAPPMKLKVGDTAPDFTLRDQNGKEVSLKDFLGKKTVVLAFYVFAFTGG